MLPRSHLTNFVVQPEYVAPPPITTTVAPQATTAAAMVTTTRPQPMTTTPAPAPPSYVPPAPAPVVLPSGVCIDRITHCMYGSVCIDRITAGVCIDRITVCMEYIHICEGTSVLQVAHTLKTTCTFGQHNEYPYFRAYAHLHTHSHICMFGVP